MWLGLCVHMSISLQALLRSPINYRKVALEATLLVSPAIDEAKQCSDFHSLS